MKRRGQSEIITTILLILIVLAAVVVVWMVIAQFLKAPTSECTEVRLSIVSIDKTAGASKVSITRAGGTGASITVSDVYVAVDGTRNALSAGLLPIETKAVSTNNIAVGSKIEVAAEVTTKNGDKVICPVTDRMTAA